MRLTIAEFKSNVLGGFLKYLWNLSQTAGVFGTPGVKIFAPFKVDDYNRYFTEICATSAGNIVTGIEQTKLPLGTIIRPLSADRVICELHAAAVSTLQSITLKEYVIAVLHLNNELIAKAFEEMEHVHLDMNLELYLLPQDFSTIIF